MNTMLCRAVLSAFLLIAALMPAPAQNWPSRNVTVIVPVPAGVASDIVARVVFEQVGRQVGHTFVVENRPGAGGTIGGNTVAKAAPDGHTILVWGSIAAANALYTKLPYDTLRDFTPVAALGQTPLVVVTGAGHFKSLGELVSTAKANPGKLNYATVGVGSAAHFGPWATWCVSRLCSAPRTPNFTLCSAPCAKPQLPSIWPNFSSSLVLAGLAPKIQSSVVPAKLDGLPLGKATSTGELVPFMR